MWWIINIFMIVWNLMFEKSPFKLDHSKSFKNDFEYEWSFIDLWIIFDLQQNHWLNKHLRAKRHQIEASPYSIRVRSLFFVDIACSSANWESVFWSLSKNVIDMFQYRVAIGSERKHQFWFRSDGFKNSKRKSDGSPIA